MAEFAQAWSAQPDNVGIARRTVVQWLKEAQTADPPISDIALVISEAVTNAVNHAYVGQEPGSVRIRVKLREEEIELTVEDDGAGMVPRPDSPGLGLGLPLIATVSERFETHTEPGAGTRLCIWFRRDPAAATFN